MDGAGKTVVARSGVGVTAAKNAPRPAIGSAEELKRTLLAARSITYSAQGATGPTMKKILESFGISEAMNAKTVIIDKITAPQAVAAGQADMGFTQISESSMRRKPSWPVRCRPRCRCTRTFSSLMARYWV